MIVLPVEKKIDWKRPPLVLLALVILNILIFAFYQSSDGEVINRAIDIYADENLADIEYPAYQQFQKDLEPEERLERDHPYLAYVMLRDTEFRKFLEANKAEFIKSSDEFRWQNTIDRVEKILDTESIAQLGLHTDKPNLMTLVTSQFLHGDFFHLFGNMVFLLLTGFAVETALGHGRFLGYYLLSGVGAGLLYLGIHKLSGGAATSLVGASGAISGVMAMYLALFKFKKIEFFYWLFIFTGYFRAAAIVILPAYIIKELGLLFLTEGSNVAYTAHIGGFLAGAALVVGTQLLSKEHIDDSYLNDEEVEKDPYLIKLNSMYQSIADCNFKKAWAQLNTIKKKYPNKPELDDIELNLLTALDKGKANELLLSKLKHEKISTHQADALVKLWNGLQEPKKAEFSFAQQTSFARHSLIAGSPQVAENIFSKLHNNASPTSELAILARQIGVYYDGVGQQDLAHKYKLSAQDIMQAIHS